MAPLLGRRPIGTLPLSAPRGAGLAGRYCIVHLSVFFGCIDSQGHKWGVPLVSLSGWRAIGGFAVQWLREGESE
jgi:hypothetical protein